MRKLLLTIILLLIYGTTTVYGATFSDIEGHWAENVVEEMINKKILNGFEDGTFRPNENITREQFAKILVEAMGIEKKNLGTRFEDVEEERWSKAYIETVCEYFEIECTSDGKKYFFPKQTITREEIAAIIVKISGYANETPDKGLFYMYTDRNEITEDYQKYVVIAAKKGIMYATLEIIAEPYGSEIYFSPKALVTRAQVCKILDNMYHNGMINNKTIYGDVNNDDIVNQIDEIQIMLYLEESRSVRNINIRNSDVDLDGSVTQYDRWLIRGYLENNNIQLPHRCGSNFFEKYEEIILEDNSIDSVYHNLLQSCACGEIKIIRKAEHEFVDSVCQYCNYSEKPFDIMEKFY